MVKTKKIAMGANLNLNKNEMESLRNQSNDVALFCEIESIVRSLKKHRGDNMPPDEEEKEE